MNFKTLLNLFRPSFVRPQIKKQLTRNLNVEPLEDRTLLATFNVVTQGDAPAGSCSVSTCTFRDAVNAANSTAGADTITFANSLLDANPHDSTFSITIGSEFVITESLTITGFANAGLSISGNNNSRIFSFGGSGANVYNLNGVTLANGNGAGATLNGEGGAIMMSDADDTINIQSSIIRNNTAGDGGAIGLDEGMLNISSSLITGNSTNSEGGALRLLGTTMITNTTISGNSATGGTGEGGGVYIDDATVTIRNSTLANNTADLGSNLFIDADLDPGTAIYQNTIFALAQGAGSNVQFRNGNATATLTSNGNNLSDDATGNLGAVGDQQNVNAQLGALANNGSHLHTHALGATSPALNGGANLSGSGITTDQRGVARPQGGQFDMGAHEVEFDFGDAPDLGVGTGVGDYSTLLTDNGARHISTGPTLGVSRDPDVDGQPNASATGDDTDVQGDDEDGVTFTSLTVGENATATVSVNNQNGRVDGFIDFNRDGDFLDAGEKIIDNVLITAGSSTPFNFIVPAGASVGNTIARFRVSSGGGLSATGAAPDGEVEDHLVTINPITPDSIGVFRGANGRWFQDIGTNGTLDNIFNFGTNGDTPIVGDWNGDGVDDVGIHRTSTSLVALDIGSNGSADRIFNFGSANIDQIFVGKFNNDAIDDLMIYRPSQARFFFDLGADGTLDRSHKFGANNIDQVHIGDFNNDGIDDVLVYRASNARFFFDFSANGSLDQSHKFGANNIDTIFVGNFDGAGGDDVAIQRSGQARYFFDLGANGTLDRSFKFGSNNIDTPLVGDINGDGTDDLVIHRPSQTRFFVDLSANGSLDSSFRLGVSTDIPVLGQWAAPLLAHDGENRSGTATNLASQHLDFIVDAANNEFINDGLTSSQLAKLDTTTITIGDLPGAQLGAAINSTIIIDINGAGHGWFIDPTPDTHEEFVDLGNDGLIAIAGSAADGRVDLLTVVLHELGHILGHDHDENGLMQNQLGLGFRHRL